jgi:hypothetical protein
VPQVRVRSLDANLGAYIKSAVSRFRNITDQSRTDVRD